MSKVIIVLAGVLMSGAMIMSCGSSGDGKGNDNGRSLYQDEKRLLQQYIDTLRHTPDSVDVTGILDRYRESLLSLNMKYPADTDLELTQGENDTIFMLTKQLLSLAEKRGFDLDSVIEELPDTIARPVLPEIENTEN